MEYTKLILSNVNYGENKYITEIIADKVSFLSSKKTDEISGQ